jgi:prepilin-type N-terminal cleavage/methylation domain-containing protein
MQKNFSRGFTLIELLVVIAIIAILASIAYPVYTGVQERAKVVQDLSNLRQIGLATQMYLNDHDGVLFSTDASAPTWMAQLHPKYLSAWRIFQSPFDTRPALESDTDSPISYGLNGNTKSPPGTSIAGLLMDKVANPTAFIVYAPAQDGGSTIKFSGKPSPAVTVYKAGSAAGGTHNRRTRINALFADIHSENMLWSNFIKDDDPNDATAKQRWDPYQPYP